MAIDLKAAVAKHGRAIASAAASGVDIPDHETESLHAALALAIIDRNDGQITLQVARSFFQVIYAAEDCAGANFTENPDQIIGLEKLLDALIAISSYRQPRKS